VNLWGGGQEEGAAGIASATTTDRIPARAGAARSAATRGPAPKDLPRRLLYFICVRLIRLFLFVFCRWQATGRNSVPRIGGTIIAPNHISYLDPPVAGSALDRQIFFMARYGKPSSCSALAKRSWFSRRARAAMTAT
jgi:hypothetical protein